METSTIDTIIRAMIPVISTGIATVVTYIVTRRKMKVAIYDRRTDKCKFAALKDHNVFSFLDQFLNIRIRLFKYNGHHVPPEEQIKRLSNTKVFTHVKLLTWKEFLDSVIVKTERAMLGSVIDKQELIDSNWWTRQLYRYGSIYRDNFLAVDGCMEFHRKFENDIHAYVYKHVHSKIHTILGVNSPFDNWIEQIYAIVSAFEDGLVSSISDVRRVTLLNGELSKPFNEWQPTERFKKYEVGI